MQSMPCPCLLFCPGADGLFMVVDERGVFRDDNFQAAVAALQEARAAAATKASGGKGAGGKDGKGRAKSVSAVCTRYSKAFPTPI